MVGMTTEASNLRQEALRQLGNTPGHQNDTGATIAWIGYDAPQVPGWNDVTGSVQGGWGVSHDDIARTGAQNLANFYDGLQSAHEGGPAHLTAIGHSYGSLTAGLALQDPGNHGVSDAVCYGSPGIEATTPGLLQLQPGHVYTMETPDDPIQGVYDAKPWEPALVAGSPVLGGVLVGTGTGDFGPNPASNPHGHRPRRCARRPRRHHEPGGRAGTQRLSTLGRQQSAPHDRIQHRRRCRRTAEQRGSTELRKTNRMQAMPSDRRIRLLCAAVVATALAAAGCHMETPINRRRPIRRQTCSVNSARCPLWRTPRREYRPRWTRSPGRQCRHTDRGMADRRQCAGRLV